MCVALMPGASLELPTSSVEVNVPSSLSLARAAAIVLFCMDLLKGHCPAAAIGVVSAETSSNPHWARGPDALSSVRRITRPAQLPTSRTTSSSSHYALCTLKAICSDAAPPGLTPRPPIARAPMDPRHAADHTRDSAISGLSILEDETDEFYQQTLAKLDRDRERFRDATNGQPLRAFRRAKTTPTTVHLWEGTNSTDHQLFNISDQQMPSGTDGSPAVRPHERSPSANVPRQWGRKGVQRNDYLRRMNSTGDLQQSTNDRAQPDPDRIFRRRTLYTGDSPKDVNPDEPIPSTEPGSPLSAWRRRHSRASWQLGSRTHRAIDDIVGLERQVATDAEPERQVATDAEPEQHPGDHTSQLHQRSIPEVQQKREIDSIKTRAVTTSRLAEAAKRSTRTRTSHTGASRPVGQEAATEDVNARDAVKEERDVNPSMRQKHRHQDSRDLLKQLARVSSLSPSPGENRPPPFRLEDRSQSSPQTGAGPIYNSSSPRRDALRHSRSAYVIPQRDRRASDGVAGASTPRVTGAWIDTPNSRPSHPFQMAHAIDGDIPPDRKVGGRPKSALEGVLQQASRARLSGNALRAQNISSVRQNGDDGAALTTASSEELGDDTFLNLQDMAMDDTTELHSLPAATHASCGDTPPPAAGVADDDKKDRAQSRTHRPPPSPPATEYLPSPAVSPPAPKSQTARHTRAPADIAKARPTIPPAKSHAMAVSNTAKTPVTQPPPAHDTDITPEENAIQQAIHFETLAIQYFDPKLRALPPEERMDRIFHAAQSRDRSIALIRQYAARLQQHTPQRCPHCESHAALPVLPSGSPLDAMRQTALTLWTLLTWRTFFSAKRRQPTHAGYALLALLVWLLAEESLCDQYCHPAARTYFPPFRWFDPLTYQEHPVKPYVTYTVLLREPLWFVVRPLEHILGWTIVVPFLALDWCFGSWFVWWWMRGYEERFGGFVAARMPE